MRSTDFIVSVRPERNDFPDGYNKLFSMRKRAILSKIKDYKELHGGVLGYAAQATTQADAEIVQVSEQSETPKGPFLVEN